MAIKQLTVFVENRRGKLAEVTGLLAEHGVNMNALSIADTQEFGILRLIVDDPEKALGALKEGGFIVQITDVVGLKLADRPGELSKALGVLDAGGINLEYLYAFLSHADENAYIALRVEDNAEAEKVLRDAGFETT